MTQSHIPDTESIRQLRNRNKAPRATAGGVNNAKHIPALSESVQSCVPARDLAINASSSFVHSGPNPCY